MPESYITADDVAQKLNVSKPTVYGWIHRGVAPPYVRLNGSVRFPLGKFNSWLQKKLISPHSDEAAA